MIVELGVYEGFYMIVELCDLVVYVCECFVMFVLEVELFGYI